MKFDQESRFTALKNRFTTLKEAAYLDVPGFKVADLALQRAEAVVLPVYNWAIFPHPPSGGLSVEYVFQNYAVDFEFRPDGGIHGAATFAHDALRDDVYLMISADTQNIKAQEAFYSWLNQFATK